MIRLSMLVCSVLLAVAHGSDALAQDCSRKPFDTFEDKCRVSYIEVDSDDGLQRVYEGDAPYCFTPRKGRKWIWYCRGYEEGARCSASHGENVAVSATMKKKGVVEWNCFEQ